MTRNQKLKILLMTVIIAVLVFGTNFILCRQLNSESDIKRVENFYELEENSLDMILIGASTSYTNYSAPLAWKEYGYTSYSLGTNMAPMGLAKSMLIEARKTQNPKVFVIDINGILYNDEQESREGGLRLWIDNMKSSQNKTNTIKELVPEKDQLSYHIPFLKYHSNWPRFFECVKASINDLLEKDNDYLAASGMEGNTRVVSQKDYVDIKQFREESPMYDLSGKHLKDLLEYCKKENLKNVMFTNMPRYYSKKMLPERGRNNSAKALIKEYGYECLDMDEFVNEIGLDPNTDFYNPNHLNIYGQKKMTYYLGNLLNNRYQLAEGKRDEKISKRYDKEVDGYKRVYEWADKQAKEGKKVRYEYELVKRILEDGKDK
ncbi:MAG: hypothetical protein RR602_02835 [Longicatena sp.]